MKNNITWVGMDVHKNTINICVGLIDKTEQQWEISNEPKKVHKLVKKLEKLAPGEIRSCYEAGPCGFVLKRQLEEESRIVCEVVAPSLIPKKPGDRVKTDSRDSRTLMHMHRAGLLTEVYAPTQEQESVRDLSRCREAARQDLTRARHRLSKWLLRRALQYKGSNWTKKHKQWLRGLKFDNSAEQVVFHDYLQNMEHMERRIERLDDALEQLCQTDSYREVIGWLRCFHGIDMITAMGIATELFDIRRFSHPRKLMSYLGQTPGEHSSGESSRRMSITKAGNAHVRWLLTEAAWHYQHRFQIGVSLTRRRQGQPQWVIDIADKARHRLNRRFYRLKQRNMPTQKVVIAVARELSGFIWDVMRHWEPPQKAAIN